MSRSHSATIRYALIEATRRGWRLFLNVVGGGWVGTVTEEYFTTKDNQSERKIRIIEMMNAHFVKFGVLVPSTEKRKGKVHGGSLDLIGWRTVRIRPEHVGKDIAQYMEFDAKTPEYSRMSMDQKNRVKQIRRAGGVAGIFRRSDKGVEIDVLSEWEIGERQSEQEKTSQ